VSTARSPVHRFPERRQSPRTLVDTSAMMRLELGKFESELLFDFFAATWQISVFQQTTGPHRDQPPGQAKYSFREAASGIAERREKSLELCSLMIGRVSKSNFDARTSALGNVSGSPDGSAISIA